IAALFGKQRSGSRILAAVGSALAQLKDAGAELLEEEGFWLTARQRADVPLRNRSRAPANLRKASLLPPMEIAAAVAEVVKQNGAIPLAELPRAVAVLFGFQRAGPELRPAVMPVVGAIIRSGQLVEGPGGLRLSDASGAEQAAA